MRIKAENRLPNTYDLASLAKLFRDFETQVNALSEGYILAATNAATAAPTTGTYQKGDFIRHSSPTRAGTAGSRYIIVGYVCTVAGTPGTWEEVHTLTEDITFPTQAPLSSKVITFTRAPGAASGNVAYTGVGFKPTALVGFGAQGASTNVGFNAVADSALTSAALFDGTASSPSFANAFVTVGIVGANQSSAIASYDTDGFTLAWTKTGAPGGGNYSIAVLCLR